MQHSPVSAQIVALLAHSKHAEQAEQPQHKDSAQPAQIDDTHSVAALALIVQAAAAAADRPASSAAAAASATAAAAASTGAAAAAASSAAASSSPVYPALPVIAALLPVPFLSRLLFSGCAPSDPRLPVGALPPLREGGATASDGASYPELALRALYALAANPQAVQVLVKPSSSSSVESASSSSDAAAANVVALLLAWLQSPSFTTAPPELRPQLLILAMQVMERMAAAAATTSEHSDASPAACTPTLALTQLQPLTHLLPALHGDVELACVRTLSWLLPAALSVAPTAQRAVACKHLIPTFAALFARDTGLLKLESLRVLVALHEVAATMTTPEEEPVMLPLPQPLLSMRAALEQLLASKLDLPVRLQLLKLCRLLLQQHGPMFATVPASYSRGPGNAARRASNVAHTSFVQLLANIPVIEMRMTLMLSSSTRPADIALMQGAGGRMRNQILLESMQLIRFLLTALLGDDDDLQEEVRAYQWWNLPADVLLQIKKRLDECSESWLSHLHDLASHPAHPRSPYVLWELAQCVALWMAEEEGAAGQLEVHQTLPFLVNIKNPHATQAAADSAASSSSPAAGGAAAASAGPSSILSLLLPSLLFLSTNWDAALILRDQDVPRRLVSEVLLDVWSRGVEKQAALLLAEAKSSAAAAASNDDDDDEDLPAAERAEIQATLAHQLIRALMDLSNVSQVLFNLVHEHAAALKRLQPQWPQLRAALSGAIHIAQTNELQSQDTEFVLEEAVESMRSLLNVCTKKFGNGSK